MKRVHLWISGIVQGVCFRYFTRQKADELGVCGWVRNCPDGGVEAVIEGEADRVDKMLRWSHTGPPHAHVTGVKAEWEEYQAKFSGFSIRV